MSGLLVCGPNVIRLKDGLSGAVINLVVTSWAGLLPCSLSIPLLGALRYREQPVSSVGAGKQTYFM